MTAEATPHRGRFAGSNRTVRWLAVSVTLALLIGALLLVLPLGSSAGCSNAPVGQGAAATEAECYQTRHGLLEQEGWSLAGIVFIPAVLCAAPLLAPRRARRPVILGAIALLGVAVILGAASVGLFYLPVMVTMGIAAAHARAATAVENPQRN